MKPELSIIVPAFDESERIVGSTEAILSFLRDSFPSGELIIIDDGSTDATREAAERICSGFPEVRSRVISYSPNHGKGYAVRKGLEAAEADIALFTDADLSTPIEEVPKLVDLISGGECDVAFGSRALDRSLIGTRQPWRREQGGKVFNLLVRMLTGLPFWDTQCGFKAFDMRKFRPLLGLMTIERFGFDVEFLFVARMKGLRLCEVPVRWNHDDRTKVDVLRDSRRMFEEVRMIRRNARRGAYDRDGKA